MAGEAAPMKSLRNQIAVITGASSGIGNAIARCLAKHGAKLHLVGRNLEKLKEIETTIASASGSVSIYRADLALDQALFGLIERLKQDLQRVEILIHSAGVISLGRIRESTVENFDWQYRINVRAPYILTQGLLPLLRSARGQVVFVNSTAGLVARSGIGQYAATKHALKAMADTLRDEENANGVRVLSIFLGRTATPMQAAVLEKEGRAYAPERLLQPKDVAKVLVDALCTPRSAEVTDIKLRPAKKLE